MSDLVLVVLIATFVGGFFYTAGREVGHKQYHRGEIICQKTLSGDLDCIKKERAKP